MSQRRLQRITDPVKEWPWCPMGKENCEACGGRGYWWSRLLKKWVECFNCWHMEDDK